MSKKEELPGYGEVCAVSLFVCGESLACYKNDPGNVQYFSLGPNYNEVMTPTIMAKQKQQEAIQAALNKELELEYE